MTLFAYEPRPYTDSPPEGLCVAVFQFSLWTREEGHRCFFEERRTGKCFALNVYDAESAKKFGKPVSRDQVIKFFWSNTNLHSYRLTTQRDENGDLVWEGVEPVVWRATKREG